MEILIIVGIALVASLGGGPKFPKRCLKIGTIDKKLVCTGRRCLYSIKEDREYYLLNYDKLKKGTRFCMDGMKKHKKGELERYMR